MPGRGLVTAIALVALASCNESNPRRAAPTTTSEPTTTTSTSTTTSTLPAATAPSCPAIPARAAPSPTRPRYELRLDVRPAESLVAGDVSVRFVPDRDTDRLVFRLWPNGGRG